ncbi:hypothetical protein ABBQ32_013311 [Trebouxia sp. C0010 RCD-2024]
MHPSRVLHVTVHLLLDMLLVDERAAPIPIGFPCSFLFCCYDNDSGGAPQSLFCRQSRSATTGVCKGHHTHREGPATAVGMNIHAKGSACHRHCQVCCDACQSQIAHVNQQEGPDIRNLLQLLQKQWDHAANAQLGNTVIKPYSNMKVSWICDQCSDGHVHSWSAPVSNRSRGRGCPQCGGCQICQHNSLATKAPMVAAQWDYEANEERPDDVLAHSNQKCKSLQALYFDTAAGWDHGKNHSQPSDHPASSNYLAWWSSPQLGSWQQTIHSRTNQVQQKTARLKRIQERQSHLGLKPGRREV